MKAPPAMFVAASSIWILLAACDSNAQNANPPATASERGSPLTPDAAKVFQPLAVGDSWTFICNGAFTIVDRVTQKLRVDRHDVYALSLQIPSTPTKSIRVVQLLANDVKGNTWIYGYLVHGKVHPVARTLIVAAKPVLHKHYDYPGPRRTRVSRVFVGFEYTNRTPLGTFWVAPYFEDGGRHNYGYSQGRGVMEEDHGPNFKYDCLIKKYVLH